MHITQEENLESCLYLISSPTRRHLSRKIKIGEINTVPEGIKILTNQLSINCSNFTTRRAFKRSGLYGRKKTKKQLLQIHHRKARLTFAEKYVDWTIEDWKRVLWSDETKVCLFGPDGGDWVWKTPKEGLNKRTIQLTVKYGGGNIMVWGCQGHQFSKYNMSRRRHVSFFSSFALYFSRSFPLLQRM
jgi:hypothetical protein